jgi:thiol-disulfide isomerase/thioredoxin
MNQNARLVSVAVAIAALVALAGAVYVIGRGSGNLAAGTCSSSAKAANALEGLNTGPIAAFVLQKTPVSVAGLSFDDAKGERRSLSDWASKVVLLNLWATWCAPCREEMPHLDALQKAMGGDSFEVVPVSVDLGSPDKPKAFYSENGIENLGFFHDGKLGVFNTLKKESLAFGMPVTLLVDREGCVLGSLNGPADWASAEAKALVSGAIGSR